jgi:hypothetical protein
MPKKTRENANGDKMVSAWLPGEFVEVFTKYVDDLKVEAKEKGEIHTPNIKEVLYDFIKQGMAANPLLLK